MVARLLCNRLIDYAGQKKVEALRRSPIHRVRQRHWLTKARDAAQPIRAPRIELKHHVIYIFEPSWMLNIKASALDRESVESSRHSSPSLLFIDHGLTEGGALETRTSNY